MDGYVRIWAEDECAPDAERLPTAYRRLVGRPDAKYSKDAVKVDDWGDAHAYTLPNGLLVVESFPGATAIYAPEHYRFVFGSNTEGRHGVGAAKVAHDFFHAHYGDAQGPTGRAYAIATRYAALPRGKIDRSCSLSNIAIQASAFLDYANAHPELYFEVTRLGCGRAGYTDAQIAPLFNTEKPVNVHLPPEWR